MPGLGRKIFTAGDVLTASDVQNYMMDQSVMYFAGTAARSSAIATPTTGMTSYIGVTGTATIPQLETYTGSAWQTPYGSTLVANVPFSAASQINVNNVFTSAYENYKLEIQATHASTQVGLNLQFAVGGTISATGYAFASFYVAANTASGVNFCSTGQTFATIGQATNTAGDHTSVTLFGPALAKPTTASFLISYGAANATFGNAYHSVGTAYDGLRLSPNSGTITGTLRIYGLRNS